MKRVKFPVVWVLLGILLAAPLAKAVSTVTGLAISPLLGNDNRMFAGGNLPGVPVRTYGRLGGAFER